jgi:O-acetylserine/cysteine efflux transporter
MGARELIFLVLMSTIWGFHFVVIKTIVGEIPPILYAAIRMSLVAAVMAPFLRWRTGLMGPVLAAGLCFGAFNYALMFSGMRLATASSAAIAMELYVPFATVLSIVFLGEKVGWRRALGIAFAFAGVALIALGRPGGDDGEPLGLGVALVALAAFTEAVGAILVKRARGFRPQELLAWFSLMGVACLWPTSALLERGHFTALAAVDPWLLAGAVLYSAVGASVLGHTIYYWLLQRLPVSQVAPSALLTALLAVAFSVAFLGDPVTPQFAIGGAMTLTGVGVVLLRMQKRPIIAPEIPPLAASAEAPEAAAGKSSQ